MISGFTGVRPKEGAAAVDATVGFLAKHATEDRIDRTGDRDAATVPEATRTKGCSSLILPLDVLWHSLEIGTEPKSLRKKSAVEASYNFLG